MLPLLLDRNNAGSISKKFIIADVKYFLQRLQVTCFNISAACFYIGICAAGHGTTEQLHFLNDLHLCHISGHSDRLQITSERYIL